MKLTLNAVALLIVVAGVCPTSADASSAKMIDQDVTQNLRGSAGQARRLKHKVKEGEKPKKQGQQAAGTSPGSSPGASLAPGTNGVTAAPGTTLADILDGSSGAPLGVENINIAKNTVGAPDATTPSREDVPGVGGTTPTTGSAAKLKKDKPEKKKTGGPTNGASAKSKPGKEEDQATSTSPGASLAPGTTGVTANPGSALAAILDGSSGTLLGFGNINIAKNMVGAPGATTPSREDAGASDTTPTTGLEPKFKRKKKLGEKFGGGKKKLAKAKKEGKQAAGTGTGSSPGASLAPGTTTGVTAAPGSALAAIFDTPLLGGGNINSAENFAPGATASSRQDAPGATTATLEDEGSGDSSSDGGTERAGKKKNGSTGASAIAP